MKLLVLGGTLFVGRHVVEAALARGHEVTLFNRGRTNAHLFRDLERLRGDRNGRLDALRGRTWDAVVDTSAEVPRHVMDTAQLLAESVEHYTLLSSIMVYSDLTASGIDEDSPVETLHPGEDPDVYSNSLFGVLKVLSEKCAEALVPGRALAVRMGLPVGPYDFTDRLAYWPRRVADGGEVLAPGHPDRPVQFIDARDLADWLVRMAENRHVGVFNAVGPGEPLTLGGLLHACKTVTDSDARFTWVGDEFLLEQDVRPLFDLPIWLPESESGLYTISNRKAVAAGLTFRPLAETLGDLLPGPNGRRNGRSRSGGGRSRRVPGQTGMGRPRETRLLQAWHQQA